MNQQPNLILPTTHRMNRTNRRPNEGIWTDCCTHIGFFCGYGTARTIVSLLDVTDEIAPLIAFPIALASNTGFLFLGQIMDIAGENLENRRNRPHPHQM